MDKPAHGHGILMIIAPKPHAGAMKPSAPKGKKMAERKESNLRKVTRK